MRGGRANRSPMPKPAERRLLRKTRRHAYHKHNPAGTKLARRAAEHRLTLR